MNRFFTQNEIYLMLDHNVPIETAKQRIRIGWERERALTEPVKKRKLKKAPVQSVVSIDKLNWKTK